MRQPDNLPAFCRVHRNGRPLIGYRASVGRRVCVAAHRPPRSARRRTATSATRLPPISRAALRASPKPGCRSRSVRRKLAGGLHCGASAGCARYAPGQDTCGNVSAGQCDSGKRPPEPLLLYRSLGRRCLRAEAVPPRPVAGKRLSVKPAAPSPGGKAAAKH